MVFYPLVQYLAFLYQYIKEWRQNPQWSFTCSLALLLPLNDLQGEIRHVADQNILKSELQTGEIEAPSIASSAKDSGAIKVTLKSGEGKTGDGETIPELKKRNCKATKDNETKCDQGTQIELSTLPVPVAMTSATMVRLAVGGHSTHFLVSIKTKKKKLNQSWKRVQCYQQTRYRVFCQLSRSNICSSNP